MCALLALSRVVTHLILDDGDVVHKGEDGHDQRYAHSEADAERNVAGAV